MTTDRSNRMMRAGVALAALAAAGLACGCGATMQARKATPSGFLKDYTQLKPGADGQARLVYVNPATDFRKYDKILLDPVRVYAGAESKIAKIPREDLQKLVNYFDAALREQLKADYKLVDQAGPGVMRIQVALTGAGKSIVVLDVISSITPPGIAVSALKQVATGSPAATGWVGAECQAVDSVSGERLFAAVDARVGQKYTGEFDKFEAWRAAQGAFDYWAKLLQQRLREHREKGGK